MAIKEIKEKWKEIVVLVYAKKERNAELAGQIKLNSVCRVRKKC